MEVLPFSFRIFHRHRMFTNDLAVTGGHVTRVLNRSVTKSRNPIMVSSTPDGLRTT